MMMNQRERNALDRHITGNYGEDSVPDEVDFCPFCGSTNIDYTCGDKQTDGRAFYFVFCNKCEACGPSDYDREGAIEAWKQRTTEAE